MDMTPVVAGIPDHVSVFTDSPHYFPRCADLGVKVNGVVANLDVLEFCVSERWVKRMARLPNGKVRKERGRPVAFLQSDVTVEPFWRR